MQTEYKTKSACVKSLGFFFKKNQYLSHSFLSWEQNMLLNIPIPYTKFFFNTKFNCIMARPQETSNKKEMEKKRLQKKKEKEQRKEERKANSKEGLTLEDMMAYVDENGNIVSTPPDPNKKKAIKVEDVVIGSRNNESATPVNQRTGIVTFFNVSKGFGFIRDTTTKESIFVGSKSITTRIQENDTVTFETEMGPKGLNAINVKLVR
jgi:cold shock CspA family protein